MFMISHSKEAKMENYHQNQLLPYFRKTSVLIHLVGRGRNTVSDTYSGLSLACAFDLLGKLPEQ